MIWQKKAPGQCLIAPGQTRQAAIEAGLTQVQLGVELGKHVLLYDVTASSMPGASIETFCATEM